MKTSRPVTVAAALAFLLALAGPAFAGHPKESTVPAPLAIATSLTSARAALETAKKGDAAHTADTLKRLLQELRTIPAGDTGTDLPRIAQATKDAIALAEGGKVEQSVRLIGIAVTRLEGLQKLAK